MSSQTFVVFCAKAKKNKKDNMLVVTPQANTPMPIGNKSMIIDREERDSTRTKAGNRHMKSSKEPDSTDDAFKDLAVRLAKKEKPQKTNDSILDDDENPLAQFQMPERPSVEPNQDGAKLENIVEMQKKPRSTPTTTKAPTPLGAPITAKDASLSKPAPEVGVVVGEKGKSKKSQKSKLPSPPVVTDKTQSDPRGKDVDRTQIGTVEEKEPGGEKKEKSTMISYNDITLFQLKPFAPAFFSTWNSCVQREFLGEKETAEQFWKNFKDKSQKCDKEARISEKMEIIPLRNRDEMKYAVLPVQEMKDINQNVTFYGADPIVKENAELYSKIGQFFPFAVGGKAGFSTASVLKDGEYVDIPVVHVDVYYFLSEVLKEDKIDYLWIDAEYAEYGFLDIFYKNGPLTKKGIVFCQMSLEVHNPNQQQKEQFKGLIETLVEEKQYGFFHSENVGHMRMWMFNFGSHYCVRKFFG
ncbi:hypothetical protein CAEBREN_05201 [Caenorhabditis brenneri]|uniref:Methyltransferase FkbM domain-containing protein n=1 Tax=Caenorhabditis brenneri TaxID=135651 RepID=G0MNW4_CAEBE|nr:hypothetical protein CAEBREN_05201 [Caenorhabditis brenneri]